MLVELAIGDAYGAGFEYVASRIVRANNDLAGYRQHPRYNIGSGRYTDDTQMSIAVAEVLVSGKAWNRESLADAFVGAFKRDPREGYAGRFYTFLETVRNGSDFLARIQPNSDKSGAAMRACPIGVCSDIATVISRAESQAKLTHNTAGGTAAAVAAALMSHYFLYDLGPKDRLAEFLAEHVAGDWGTPWRGKVGARGMMSVRAAVTAVVASAKLSDVLRSCVAFTGDVDTVATIALAAATHATEIENDLPVVLYDELERGPFGYEYLRSLDAQLTLKRHSQGET